MVIKISHQEPWKSVSLYVQILLGIYRDQSEVEILWTARWKSLRATDGKDGKAKRPLAHQLTLLTRLSEIRERRDAFPQITRSSSSTLTSGKEIRSDSIFSCLPVIRLLNSIYLKSSRVSLSCLYPLAKGDVLAIACTEQRKFITPLFAIRRRGCREVLNWRI